MLGIKNAAKTAAGLTQAMSAAGDLMQSLATPSEQVLQKFQGLAPAEDCLRMLSETDLSEVDRSSREALSSATEAFKANQPDQSEAFSKFIAFMNEQFAPADKNPDDPLPFMLSEHQEDLLTANIGKGFYAGPGVSISVTSILVIRSYGHSL